MGYNRGMTFSPTTITARYDGTCRACGGRTRAGELVAYDKTTKTVAHLVCPAVAEPVPVNPDLERVAAYLDRRVESGQVNEFEFSLWDQLSQRGRLSDKQVACIVKKLDAATLPGDDAVPAGRYALDVDGDVVFVQVWRKYGRVKVYDRDTDAEVDAATFLNLIVAAGATAAALRYGQLTGNCSRCDMELTNSLSRFLDIGPVCGKHFYTTADWTARKAAGRTWLRARGIDPTKDLPAGVVLSELADPALVAA